MAKKAKSAKKTRSTRPPRRTCATMGAHFLMLETHPAVGMRMMRMEQATARMMSLGFEELMPAEPRVIPVVVHVVYRTDQENISDAQVASQIAALNRDFRCRNADRSKIPAPFKGLAADCMIEFCLASKDPSGAKTDGITRTRTPRRSFSPDNAVKTTRGGGIEPWDTKRYLNIWVCQLTGGLLGYAQFPGGPAATDGVVILTTAFGTRGFVRPPFNKGRTATHEVGHYLNLRHIWGDRVDCTGNDFVSDTPTAMMPNYGTPTFPHISCGNGPTGDMFMNYMDYVDDSAMHLFTRGQAARMQATLAGPRRTLGG